MKHDQEVTAMFEARGWTVLRIWECELKKKSESALLDKLENCYERENQKYGKDFD